MNSLTDRFYNIMNQAQKFDNTKKVISCLNGLKRKVTQMNLNRESNS